MNKEKTKIVEGIKILILLAVLLTGAALSITACTPQQIVTGPGAPTPTVNPNYVPSSATPNPVAGSIVITAILRDGNSSISFFNTTALSSSTVIYFTNFSWDSTLNGGAGGFVDESSQNATGPTTVSEGTVSYTPPGAGLPAYTQVVIGKTGTSLAGGSVANLGYNAVSGLSNNGNAYLYFNHNGLGDKVYVFEGTSVAAGLPGGTAGPSTAGITFVNAVIFGPNTWNALQGGSIPVNDSWDSYLPFSTAYSYSTTSSGGSTSTPTGTFPYFCALDLSPLFNAMGGQNSSTQNQNALLSSCVAGSSNSLNTIETGSNWTGNALGASGFVIGGTGFGASCGGTSAGYNVTASETSY